MAETVYPRPRQSLQARQPSDLCPEVLVLFGNMITGQIKNQIDQIWDIFWESAGITNPISVLEQMTYLFFMKMLDDAQIQREAISNAFGDDYASDDTFSYGTWHNKEYL